MKHLLIGSMAVLFLSIGAQAAQAQWGWRAYQPVMVAPPPVMIAPAPVTRVYRQPAVVYSPGTVVYSRRRPILGGYSVRTRPVMQRSFVW